MSNQESSGGVTRRALLKSTALGSLALAAGGLPLPFTLRSAAAAVQQAAGDNTRIVWGPVRSTAAAAAPCGYTCVMMKWCMSKRITPATTAMAITRSAPACAGVRFAGASTTRIALTIR